jgi:hypothetical protein
VTSQTPEHRQLERALQRLNARAWGIAMGLLAGGALFLATMILVVKGGENQGQHLRLLRVFFPGYTVSFLGSFVGFIYAFVVGYATGRLIGMVYNSLVRTSK